MSPELKISKLDAANRQLETAVRLYFSGCDPVSIHTLTAAAYNILRDMTEHHGAERMLLKDQALDYMKPEYHKMIRDKLNEAENFFKHADRDHGSSLEFNPEMTELLLIDACVQYERLTSENTPLLAVYRMWCRLKFPDIFLQTDDGYNKALREASPIAARTGRGEFFAMMLPIASRISKGV